jgi:peptidyl-prolyl cis-trans isomerase A (cyclophilin A)
MANRNTAGSENHGSQFFFTLEDEPTLEGKHTAFGRVADDASLAVLQSLTVRDPRSADAPAADLIESITIEESPATSAAAP